MDYLPLALLFGVTGLLAIVYERLVLPARDLRRRLPNRRGFDGILLFAAIAAGAALVITGFPNTRSALKVIALVFSLLVTESVILLCLSWLRSNSAAVIIGILAGAVSLLSSLQNPSFLLVNTIIIIATLGATTLLLRLNWLPTSLVALGATVWTIYDVLSVTFLLPRIFVPTATPQPTLLFPAVTVGELTLGSGDFLFLVLFTLVLLRDRGKIAAIALALAEATGLVITGMLLPDRPSFFPFLIVMTPIFLTIKLAAHLAQKKEQANKTARLG